MATSAVREARNGGEFLDHVLQQTGLTVRVITGAEEARLIFLGVQNSVALPEQPTLVIDIGGGSVEVIVGKREAIFQARSLKVGAIRLKDLYLSKTPPSKTMLRELETAVTVQLKNALASYKTKRVEQIIATSGMAGNLAEVIHLQRTGEERRKVELWAEAVQNRAQLVNYTERLFQRLRDEERKKVQLWAEAMQRMSSGMGTDFTFTLKVVQDNTTVPVVIVDKNDRVLFSRNLDSLVVRDSARLSAEVRAMKPLHDPIEIAIDANQKQYLYYKDSRVFSELQEVMDGIIRSFISETVMSTASVPVIYTDSTRTRVIETGNVDGALLHDTVALHARIAAMERSNPPIAIDLPGKGRNYIFYEESLIITQLRYFPFVQLAILALFLLVAYALFSVFRNAEQNQVWVGMAKQTAHQLGTPLSSLI